MSLDFDAPAFTFRLLATLLVALLCFGTSPSSAQSTADAHDELRAGDEDFARRDFAAAELHYRRAEEAAPSFQSAYNLGVVLGRLARPAEAAAAFELARERSSETRDRGDASYNAGTARLDEQELEASVQDYAAALRAQPGDEEARQNLAHALRQLRRQRQQEQQQQEQQQQQQQQQAQQGEDDEEAPEDQGQQPDEQPSPEQQRSPSEGNAEESDREGEGEGDSAPDDPADEPPADEPPRPGDGPEAPALPADEAERLLELAAEQERATGEKRRLGETGARQPLKDW